MKDNKRQETDSKIACPDPACGLIMRIDRENKRLLDHDDVSANKWKNESK